MKKINNIVLLTAALAASLACQKTEINEQRPQSEGRFTVLVTTEEITTRTAFGTLSGDKYPTLWQAGDEVKFSLNNAEGVSATAEVVGGGTTANFSPSFTEAEAADYTIYAVSPASAAVSFAENSISVNIPSVQTPGKSSCDPAAQLLYAKSETSTAKPAEFKARFKHLTSYLKITLSNLPAGVTPAKLKLDLSSPAAGTFSYNASDNTLTAKESAVTALEASVSSNEVWFACAPVDLSGKSVPVKMTSDNGTAYVKTISFPEGRQMEAGKVYGIDIDMSAAEAVPYQKTITPGQEGFSTNGKIKDGLMEGLNYWEKDVKGTYTFSDVPVGGKYDIVLRVYYFEGWTSQLTSLSIKINNRAEESYFVTAVDGKSVKGESYITLKDVELNAGENVIVVGNGACHKGWQDKDKFFAQAGWMMVTNCPNDYVQSEKVIKVSLTPGQAGVKAIGGADIAGSLVKGIWFWDERFGEYTFENVPAGIYDINVKVNWWVDNVEVSTGIRVNGGDRLSEKVVKTTTSVTFKNVELQEGTNVIKVGRGEYGPATADECKFYPEVGTVTIRNY